MPDIDDKNMEDLFKGIFENINNWLHFAEAKNGALVALNIAILSALLSTDFFENYSLFIAVICICLLLSICIALISFSPILNRLPKKHNDSFERNLLFYSYIASFDPMEYAKQIYLTYFNYTNESSIDI